jgi:glycerol-3-phosphate dehydrogenase
MSAQKVKVALIGAGGWGQSMEEYLQRGKM